MSIGILVSCFFVFICLFDCLVVYHAGRLLVSCVDRGLCVCVCVGGVKCFGWGGGGGVWVFALLFVCVCLYRYDACHDFCLR